VGTIARMDLTSRVLHEVEFREAKKGGYHTQDVDEFLERLAVAVDRQEAQLREARQRVAVAEHRATEAERRLEEVDRRGGTTDADETLKRTLVLAQRTADAAIREAEEQSARMIATAEEEAHRLVAEAHENSAQAYADAEEEARRAQHEARTRVLAELQELEAGRELLRNDVELLEAHIEQQRERLRLTIRDLTALVEDPAALREADVPPMADVTIPQAEPAPEPAPRHGRLVAAAPPTPPPTAEAEPMWAPDDDADDYEPVPAPAPRSRASRLQAAPADEYDDDPVLDDHPAHDDLGLDDDDDLVDEEEDAYLAELRKAMNDDEPLGPRDDEDDGYGAPPSSGRSRFGRRR
jgi:cell division initiation protein